MPYLSFGQANTDKITFTDPYPRGAGFTYTGILWVKQRANPNTSEGSILGNTIDFLVWSGTIWFSNVGRAGGYAESKVTPANLFPDSNWTYIAITYSETNGVKIYRGNLTTAAAEVTYNGTPVISSGNTTTDTNNWILCNRGAANTLSPAHDIAFFGVYGNEMSLTEIQAQQYNPFITSNSKVFMYPGYNGKASTQIDFSGLGNHGTLTGTSLANSNIPLGFPHWSLNSLGVGT